MPQGSLNGVTKARPPKYKGIEERVHGPTRFQKGAIMLYVGIILVLIGILSIALLLLHRHRTEPPTESQIKTEAKIEEKINFITQGLPEYDDIVEILESEDPTVVKLSRIFDKLLLSNRISAAEKIADLILEIAPESAVGYMRLGLVSMRRGNFEKAERYLRTALDISPSLVKAMNNLAYILNYQKRFAETVELMEKNMDIVNQNTVAMINLAIAYFHLDKIKNAFELLNKVYKKDQQIPEVHLYIGHCLMKLGEHDKAMLAYQRYKALVGQEGAEEPSKEAGKAEESQQEIPQTEIATEKKEIVISEKEDEKESEEPQNPDEELLDEDK